MKQIIFTILLLTCISCGYETPMLNNPKYPFIVYKIKEVNQSHSIYYTNLSCKANIKNNFFGSWRTAIVLPSNYYNVGDTILHCKSSK